MLVAKPTAYIMDPVRSFDEENVVAHPYDVRSLKHKEYVPCSWRVLWVVERNYASNQLRRDDTETSTVGNPAKHVCSSAAVALYTS